MNSHDIGRDRGGTVAALGRATAKALVLGHRQRPALPGQRPGGHRAAPARQHRRRRAGRHRVAVRARRVPDRGRAGRRGTAAAARTLGMTRRRRRRRHRRRGRCTRDRSAAARPPASTVEAPDGVRVSVYQPRPDVPKNRMAIQVHNDGDVPLTVTSAELRSSFFTDDMVWGPDRTATVAPGYAVDLRVDLPTEADCSGVEPAADGDVRLEDRRRDGHGDRRARRPVPPDGPAARRRLPDRERGRGRDADRASRWTPRRSCRRPPSWSSASSPPARTAPSPSTRSTARPC